MMANKLNELLKSFVICGSYACINAFLPSFLRRFANMVEKIIEYISKSVFVH